MDERQQQIKEGAGLEESRLNTDFIDFVQRWGGPFLILCAVVMGAWAGWNWWQKRQAQQIDNAFAQYEAQIAGGNPSPEALKAVAEEFEGIASVSLLARLDAADVYAGSIRAGVKAGATLNQDGTLAAPEDALTDEERSRLIDQATGLYQNVLDAASAAKGKVVLAIRAAYGLAAMAECRGNVAGARTEYERIVRLAEAGGLTNHVRLARARLDGIEELASPITMLSQSELAQRPAPPAPELGPALGPDLGPAGPAPTGFEQPFESPFTPTAPASPGALPGTTPGTGEPEPQPEPGATEPGATEPASPDPNAPEPGGAAPPPPPTPPGR